MQEVKLLLKQSNRLCFEEKSFIIRLQSYLKYNYSNDIQTNQSVSKCVQNILRKYLKYNISQRRTINHDIDNILCVYVCLVNKIECKIKLNATYTTIVFYCAYVQNVYQYVNIYVCIHVPHMYIYMYIT